MTIDIPVDPFLTLLSEDPWPALALLFLLGVVLPAVWVPFCRDAAMDVLRTVLTAAADIAAALRGTRR